MDSLSVKRDAGCYLTQRLAGAQPVREEALTMPDQFDHGCGQMTYQEPLCTSALRAAVPPVRRYRVAAMPQPLTAVGDSPREAEVLWQKTRAHLLEEATVAAQDTGLPPADKQHHRRRIRRAAPS